MFGGVLWCVGLAVMAGTAVVLTRQLVQPRNVYQRVEWDEVA